MTVIVTQNNITSPNANVTALTVDTANGLKFPNAGPLSNRNLIINGAMQVAQRGTSSTSSGYHTVDRYKPTFGGVSVTQSQQALSSGDPYNEGFRYFLRTANTATSTSTTAYTQIEQRIESQNLATSGWNYTNSSSFLVSSFWVRSSLAGTYWVQYRAADSNNYYFNRSFTLSADTWTKVTHTIPGDSSVVVTNDNGIGLEVVVVAHYGTGWQGSTATDGSWFTRSNDEYFPSSTFSQNWANTASATFDITGVQLEVGSVATPFEHRSFGQELALCQRYYEKSYNIDVVPGATTYAGILQRGVIITGTYAASVQRIELRWVVPKRSTSPTVTWYDSAGASGKCNYPDTTTGRTITPIYTSNFGASVEATSGVTGHDHRMYVHYTCSDEL